MMRALKPRTNELLKTRLWFEGYEWLPMPVLAQKLRALGHDLHPAAYDFLSRYGGFTFHRMNPYQPQSSVIFHTDALEAARDLQPGWCESGTALAGSKVCPIGGCGHGDYLLAMDEKAQVWGMNHHLEWREFADSGEDFLDDFCSTPGIK